MEDSSNSQKIMILLYFFWYSLAPIVALLSFVFVLFNSSVVTISISDYSQIVDLSTAEIAASLILFLLAVSAYFPLRRLSRKFNWSPERTRRMGLVWPLLVIVFFLVVAVDLLLVYFSF